MQVSFLDYYKLVYWQRKLRYQYKYISIPTCYHAFVSAIIPTSALDFNVSFQIEVYLLIMDMQFQPYQCLMLTKIVEIQVGNLDLIKLT